MENLIRYLQRYNNSQRRKTLPLETTPYYLLGEPASLLLLTNSHPPLSLVCQLPHPLGSTPFHPFLTHSSYYIIYIDHINNLGRLHPGQLGHGKGNVTTVAGQSGLDIWHRTTKTGQPVQVNQDMSASTGEPVQIREDKPGHVSNDRTAESGELWTRLPGRMDGTGQPGQDSQDRTPGTRKPG